ncbi:MAG: hypothetical protein ACRCXX_08710 [Cetobacterium sp.]|uniref:hypothetical protein n=1 Tax=Cetobacterium sp. TaxID=2071632 RepID=UPI003F3D4A7D
MEDLSLFKVEKKLAQYLKIVAESWDFHDYSALVNSNKTDTNFEEMISIRYESLCNLRESILRVKSEVAIIGKEDDLSAIEDETDKNLLSQWIGKLADDEVYFIYLG